MSPVLQILQTYVNMYVYILRQCIFGHSEKKMIQRYKFYLSKYYTNNLTFLRNGLLNCNSVELHLYKAKLNEIL